MPNNGKVIFEMKLKSIAGVKVIQMPKLPVGGGGGGLSKIQTIKKIWEQQTLRGESENSAKRTTDLRKSNRTICDQPTRGLDDPSIFGLDQWSLKTEIKRIEL